jgi:hypothetical protein
MIHPHYKPAVLAQWDTNIKDPARQPQGHPAKWPPVIVHNLDQEQDYASKGYLPAGVSDPDAYLRATIGAEAPGTYKFQEYPKWLYRCEDGGVQSQMVQSEAEEKRLGRHWHATPDAARMALQEDAPAVTNDSISPKAVERALKAKAKRKYTRRAKTKAAPQDHHPDPDQVGEQ